MRIEFLGTGGYHPNEHRHTACLLLPEIGVMLDAGTSTFRMPSRLQTDHLRIFLSHAHLDHIVGLTYLLVPMKQGLLRQVELYATAEVHEAVRGHLFAQSTFPVLPDFQFHTLQEGTPVALARGVRLTHSPLVSHPGGSRAFRIEIPDRPEGGFRSLAYVTDTTVDGTYTEFVRNVDLLVHECYFPDSMAEWATKTGHSCTSQVAQLARDAGVGRLVLTHIDPLLASTDTLEIEKARDIFADIDVAEDLLIVEI